MRGVQKYKRRRKYRLYMAFVSASQLREEEVLFEVSMGNYGNVLDDTLPASGSTPPSVCPQYDGQRYHFAPWAESKPCVLLESHWEDIEYRLGALNMLLRVLDRLVCTPLLPPQSSLPLFGVLKCGFLVSAENYMLVEYSLLQYEYLYFSKINHIKI